MVEMHYHLEVVRRVVEEVEQVLLAVMELHHQQLVVLVEMELHHQSQALQLHMLVVVEEVVTLA